MVPSLEENSAKFGQFLQWLLQVQQAGLVDDGTTVGSWDDVL